jgi:hypothetical protein
MSVSGSVSRAELGLADLALFTDTYTVALDGLDVGAVAWRRETVTSPYVHGAFEVGAVKDLTTLGLRVEVRGTSASDLQTKLSTLLAAFTQSTYTFSVTVNGSSYAWTCFRADYGVVFDPGRVLANQAQVSLQIPRQPVPVTGPY